MFNGGSAESPSKPAAAAKRSLFTKPAWSKTPAATTNEDVDLFSRSKGSYAAIAKEEEERLKRKQAKKERERRRELEEADSKEGKRRRLLEDDDPDTRPPLEAHGRSSENGGVQIVDLEDSDLEDVSYPINRHERDGRSDSHGNNPAQPQNRPSHSPTEVPVVLSDGEDVQPIPQLTKPRPAAGEDEDPESDEELAALARQARQRARQQIDGGTRKTQTPDLLSPRHPPTQASPPLSQAGSNTTFSPSPDEAKVELLITSRIQNTTPLIVHRRLHQRLKDVRLAWCGKQAFGEEETKSVFLTWRGKRLFDVTTCKGLGITVGAEGNVVFKGARDLQGHEGRKIHLEAMTEAIFDEQRRRRERGLDYDSPGADADPGEKAAEAPPPPPDEEQIRLVIKSRTYADFKLIVKPTTKISRIIGAFIKANRLESGKEVSLHFDGEKMDPEEQVTDTELGDLDHVDASVK